MSGTERTRTKVVATLGPASSDAAVIGAMVDAGMDVARLNFSHGEPGEHRERLRLARRAAAERGASLAVLADLQGPKIRVDLLAGDGYPLQTGVSCELIAGANGAPDPSSPDPSGPPVGVPRTPSAAAAPPAIPVTYERLADDLDPGDRVLLDDGAIELEVRSISGRRVGCVVRRGGVLRSHNGVNLPGVRVSAPSLTPKDRRDLASAIAAGVDYVALSFVRRPGDVTDAKRAIADLGADVPLVAKLERPEAIEHLDGILDAADAVMVARGDLGVELAVEKVPPLQKEIIARANGCGVPVITATQMLESMVSSQRPTRAEASDVANAVFDGTDAVMLSQETAIGSYPVEAVATMRRIAEEAESTPGLLHPPPPPSGGPLDVAATTCKAAVQAATDLDARAIVAFTETGASARFVSRFRPLVPIVGLTAHEATRRRMAMYWGVRALPPVDPSLELAEMVQQADQRLRAAEIAGEGDLIVLVAGARGMPAATNRMIVHRLGSADAVQ
jgi:pyruvate kinase